jgi:hypothetical protein
VPLSGADERQRGADRSEDGWEEAGEASFYLGVAKFVAAKAILRGDPDEADGTEDLQVVRERRHADVDVKAAADDTVGVGELTDDFETDRVTEGVEQGGEFDRVE